MSDAQTALLVGGAGAAAALLQPFATADVLVAVGGTGVWSGAHPEATVTSVGRLRLTGFGSGSLTFSGADVIGPFLVFQQQASGLSVSGSFALTAYGSHLPLAASQWSHTLSSPLTTQAVYWYMPGAAATYLGYKVSGVSGTLHYWVLTTPGPAGLAVAGYGSLASTAGGDYGGSTSSAGSASTPEPTASGLGLLALGAAGVMRQRRKRKRNC